MESNNTYHIPVLLEESIEYLDIKPDGIYVDLTFGGGGHSRHILSRLGPSGRLYSFDQDSDTRANCPDDPRFVYVESNFKYLRSALRYRGVEKVDGILADLGVSSHHFDEAERGFSFRADAELDMRMNQRSKFTARDIVNGYTGKELQRIFTEWGELDTTYKISNCIERARKEKPINTTGELIEAVESCTPQKDPSRFLSRLFQALRIEVNGEMEALKMALEQSFKILNPGGTIVVISYHSLEDRIVKNFLKSGNSKGIIEKDFYGQYFSPYVQLTPKPVVPLDEELERNPRSRSAKLRAAMKQKHWKEKSEKGGRGTRRRKRGRKFNPHDAFSDD